MNGKVDLIKATEVAIQTGNVWAATFPHPGAKFLEDMGWKVYDSPQHHLRWEAHGLRQRTLRGKRILEIRFFDRERPPIKGGSDVTVEIVRPMP